MMMLIIVILWQTYNNNNNNNINKTAMMTTTISIRTTRHDRSLYVLVLLRTAVVRLCGYTYGAKVISSADRHHQRRQ